MLHDPFGRVPEDLPIEPSTLRRTPAARQLACVAAQPEPSLAEIMTLVRRLSAQVADLTTITTALLKDRTCAQRTLDRGDHRALALLLPVIDGACRGARFTVRDLLDQATLNDDLRQAIEQAVGSTEGSAKRVGKLFARAEATGVAGYRIARAGAVREGVLWQVEHL